MLINTLQFFFFGIISGGHTVRIQNISIQRFIQIIAFETVINRKQQLPVLTAPGGIDIFLRIDFQKVFHPDHVASGTKM